MIRTKRCLEEGSDFTVRLDIHNPIPWINLDTNETEKGIGFVFVIIFGIRIVSSIFYLFVWLYANKTMMKYDPI